MLTCPRCGGRLRLIAVVDHPAVVAASWDTWRSPPRFPGPGRHARPRLRSPTSSLPPIPPDSCRPDVSTVEVRLRHAVERDPDGRRIVSLKSCIGTESADDGWSNPSYRRLIGGHRHVSGPRVCEHLRVRHRELVVDGLVVESSDAFDQMQARTRRPPGGAPQEVAVSEKLVVSTTSVSPSQRPRASPSI